jgi:hypothetical protein
MIDDDNDDEQAEADEATFTDDDDDGPRPSLCDGDRRNNYWIEGGDPNLGNGVCMLDNLTEEQVVYHLQHNWIARRDLAKVTTNATVLRLLGLTELLPPTQEDDGQMKHFNAHDRPESIPFYAIFKGRPPSP